MITNLLDNAVKYSEGTSLITLEAGVSADLVRISVHDRGKGLQPEQIPLLFDRFNRGEIRDGKGFGLGLYIVRLLTEAHGGHVFACSQPGKGSTFSVYFPLWS